MIKKFSHILAKHVVWHNHENSNEEIYQYGFEIIINSLISIISVLLLGFIFDNFWNSVIYLLTYCSIRIYAGGYHAGNNFKCIVLFILAYICSPVLMILYKNLFVVLSAIVTVNIVIYLWAPVDTIQNPILDSEKRVLRKKAIVLTIIASALVVCGIFCGFYTHIASVAVALTYIGFVVTIGKWKRGGKKWEN